MDICCQKMVTTVDACSPFERIIGLDWYDGLLEGFAQCTVCDAAYYFIAIGWDAVASIGDRVYALMPIRDNVFNIIKILELLGSPCWPVWMPLWIFANDSDKEQAEQQLNFIINKAGVPEYIINAYCDSLRVIKAKRLVDRHDISAVEEVISSGEISSNKIKYDQWLGPSHG